MNMDHSEERLGKEMFVKIEEKLYLLHCTLKLISEKSEKLMTSNLREYKMAIQKSKERTV